MKIYSNQLQVPRKPLGRSGRASFQKKLQITWIYSCHPFFDCVPPRRRRRSS